MIVASRGEITIARGALAPRTTRRTQTRREKYTLSANKQHHMKCNPSAWVKPPMGTHHGVPKDGRGPPQGGSSPTGVFFMPLVSLRHRSDELDGLLCPLNHIRILVVLSSSMRRNCASRSDVLSPGSYSIPRQIARTTSKRTMSVGDDRPRRTVSKYWANCLGARLRRKCAPIFRTFSVESSRDMRTFSTYVSAADGSVLTTILKASVAFSRTSLSRSVSN